MPNTVTIGGYTARKMGLNCQEREGKPGSEPISDSSKRCIRWGNFLGALCVLCGSYSECGHLANFICSK